MTDQKSPIAKTTVIIFLTMSVLINAVGNVCLSHGMRTIGAGSHISTATLYETLRRAVDHPAVLWGIGLLVVFFGLFLLLLSWADLSFVLPLLSVSYVVNVILARLILQETVPVTRWLGIVVICLGAYYISTTLEADSPIPEQRNSASRT